jgi:hypothetical protein
MATPFPGKKKYKWPSEQQKSGASVSDFVPYISNLTNMFKKVPQPIAPKLVDPISVNRVSLDQAKSQVENDSRVADLSTKGFDSQTGAALRVGNMANKFRALSDINSKEGYMNAMIGNQTNQINASIDAQNTGITNAYHDDVVNAQIAGQRQQSENVSNAADKYMMQQTVKDQVDLEKEKARIGAQAYSGGVYDRLMGRLGKTGVDTSKYGYEAPHASPFDKFRNMDLPAYTPQSSTPLSTGNTNMTDMQPKELSALKSYIKQRKTYAAGGMLKVFGSAGEGGGGGERKPVLVDPVQSPTQFKRHSLIAGTNAFDDKTYAMDYPTNRTASGIDIIHNIVGSGLLPNQLPTDVANRQTLNPKMYQYLYQFNQRPDLKGMNADQRIQTFYNIPSSDPELQSMKDNMKRFGYGPAEFRRNQPSTYVPAVKRGYGGKMIKPFC